MLLLYKVHGTKYILLLYKVAPIDSYKTCLIGTANRFSYPDMPYVNGRIESRCRQWQPLRKNDQIGDRHLISCWFYWPSSKLVKNGSSSYLIASYGRPDRDLIFDSVETKALSLSRGHPLVLNASYWLLYTVCKLIPLFPRKKIEANPWSLVRGDKYGTVHVKCCKSSCKGFNGRTQLWLVSRGDKGIRQVLQESLPNFQCIWHRHHRTTLSGAECLKIYEGAPIFGLVIDEHKDMWLSSLSCKDSNTRIRG
jgi:hypothetical protein